MNSVQFVRFVFLSFLKLFLSPVQVVLMTRFDLSHFLFDSLILFLGKDDSIGELLTNDVGETISLLL